MMQGKPFIIITVSSNSFNYLQTHKKHLQHLCCFVVDDCDQKEKLITSECRGFGAENWGWELKGSLRF